MDQIAKLHNLLYGHLIALVSLPDHFQILIHPVDFTESTKIIALSNDRQRNKSWIEGSSYFFEISGLELLRFTLNASKHFSQNCSGLLSIRFIEFSFLQIPYFRRIIFREKIHLFKSSFLRTNPKSGCKTAKKRMISVIITCIPFYRSSFCLGRQPYNGFSES